jgi:SSS family transporter
MGLALDGLIIVFYFAAIVCMGLYMGRRERSLHDFALGGRRVPWWAVMASIIAAETSAATFIGTPGEGYEKRSLAYTQLILGLILGRIFVGFVFLKPYYTFKVYTVYDYLAIRFGEKTKNYVSALFLVMRTLASGTRMFVPSIVMVLAWQLAQNGGNPVHISQGAGTVKMYIIAIAALTCLTCIYTALGGIKAVIWTDLIQATLMFTSALLAIASILHHIGGFDGLTQAVPEMQTHVGYFFFGWEDRFVQAYKADHPGATMGAWDWIRLTIGSDYTIFSAIIASGASNMAAFGTDQDMVQRLLTAETYKKSRRSLIMAAIMDLPIAAAFAFIGVLLVAFYQQNPSLKPPANADVFPAYILNVMRPGLRGILLAGVFATAMGSLSTALNALATSLTNDWYIPYFAKNRDAHHHVTAARWFTALFALFMILIAGVFAYAKVTNPSVRIIPVVLGIAGFILGPMLGVFLIGMLTKSRGSDTGNMIAITLGLLVTIYLGNLHVDFLNLLGLQRLARPAPIKVSFTWFAMIGAMAVFVIGIFFKTPAETLESARRRAIEADRGEDKPVALRDDLEAAKGFPVKLRQ